MDALADGHGVLPLPPTPDAVHEMVQRRLQASAAHGEPAGDAQAPSGFRFLPLAEVLAAQQAPDWLIRGYLEADTLAVLFGASGSMKSFVAIDLSFCIATGLTWHGAPVPRPGPVFYIAGEGFRGLAKRIRALMVAHGIQDVTAVPLYLSAVPAQLLIPESVEAVIQSVEALAKQHGPPRFIIIDTLNRCFGPGNENDTEDMTAFVAALDRLRSRFGCAVLVVHHTGLKDTERARGASALKAALDFEYRLDMNNRQRTLKCTKSKDHDAPPAITFEPITVATGGRDPEAGQEITSCVLRKVGGGQTDIKANSLTPVQRATLDALAAVCAASGRASRDAWRLAALPKIIAKNDEARGKAFRRAVKDLVGAGQVQVVDGYFWPTTGADKADNIRTMTDLSGGTQTDGHGHTP